MKNKQVFTLFGLILIVPVWATQTVQTPVPPPVANTTVVNPASQLQQKLDALEKFSARFEQIVYDKTGNVLQRAKGLLFIERPNHFFWETQSPDKNTIISDGQSVWLEDPSLQHTQMMDLKTVVVDTPFLLITGNDKHLWDKYTVTQTNELKYQVKPNQQHAVQALDIQFNAKNQIESLTVQEVQGNKRVYNLNRFRKLRFIPESRFKYVLPRGYTLDAQK